MTFNLENEYQSYLSLVGLKELKMNPIQRMETRRAFIAGYGMCFRKLEDIGNMDDVDAFDYLGSIQSQVEDFYKNQAIIPRTKS
jgi:hypothetical protein